MYSRFVFTLCIVFAIYLATFVELVAAAPMTAMTPGQKITENRLNQGRACIRFCMFLNATKSAEPSQVNNAVPSSDPVPIPGDAPSSSSTDEDIPTADVTSESEPISESEVTPDSSATLEPEVSESTTVSDSDAASSTESPSKVDVTPVVNTAASSSSSTNGAFRSQTTTLFLPAIIAGLSLLFLL